MSHVVPSIHIICALHDKEEQREKEAEAARVAEIEKQRLEAELKEQQQQNETTPIPEVGSRCSCLKRSLQLVWSFFLAAD